MSIVHRLRDAALFAACYIALDWASYIDPLGPFNITPWNPQPALAVAWMMLGGLLHAPIVFGTIVVADFLIRHVPGGYVVTLAAAAVLTLGYGLMAGALRRVLPAATVETAADMALFSVVIVSGSALVSGAFVGLLDAFGLLPQGVFVAAAFRFWVGDAVGILVTAPLLLAAANAAQRSALRRLASQPEAWLQAVALAATTWLIFAVLEGDAAHHFYLLFLPLIWTATRSGMAGAVVATGIVQVGVVLGIHSGRNIGISALELQALVAVLTLASLFLGVTVDERRRAESRLRQSLRLAAAGEMAGAIAHEVNQPLTALANYGETARLVLSAPPPDLAELRDLIDNIVREGNRAAGIVRRLRDFFRAGATRLERIDADELLPLLRRIGNEAIVERAVHLELRAEAGVPALLVDRIQLELVLRNLLANAAESLTAHAVPGAAISVSIERGDAERVCIRISDNGPGIPVSVREGLFEPFTTSKPRGLGLGLAVSRAIAEAHGGRLDAVPSPHGEFQLTLPCAPAG